MKRTLSPAVAAVVIIVVIGIAAFAWMKFGEGSHDSSLAASAGMPPEARAEFQRRMGASNPAQTGTVVPGAGGEATPSNPTADKTR